MVMGTRPVEAPHKIYHVYYGSGVKKKFQKSIQYGPLKVGDFLSVNMKYFSKIIIQVLYPIKRVINLKYSLQMWN